MTTVIDDFDLFATFARNTLRLIIRSAVVFDCVTVAVVGSWLIVVQRAHSFVTDLFVGWQ